MYALTEVIICIYAFWFSFTLALILVEKTQGPDPEPWCFMCAFIVSFSVADMVYVFAHLKLRDVDAQFLYLYWSASYMLVLGVALGHYYSKRRLNAFFPWVPWGIGVVFAPLMAPVMVHFMLSVRKGSAYDTDAPVSPQST